jgi:hypothetical protein
MAPRGRKKAEPKAKSTALVSALKFISVAQKDAGQPHETHCRLAHNTAVAFNGTLAAGVRIDEDITANPHTLKLLAALERCGETFSITQLDNERLSIKSEKFKAVVPCLTSDQLLSVEPDAPCAIINDSLKEGFNVVSTIVSDNSEFMVTASILLRNQTMVSTNTHILFEYWHGIDLPPLVIPKLAALAVSRCTLPLSRLGFSAGSVTFWFSDNSWIKTQQYTEKWPNVDRILNVPCLDKPIPETFYHGLDAIAPFADDNRVHCGQGILSTHTDTNLGASYEVEGLPEGPSFNLKYLKIIEPYVKTIDFVGVKGTTFFFGDKVRGLVMQIAV